MSIGPSVPHIIQHIQRDTTALFILNTSNLITYGVRSCQVELITINGGNNLKMTALLNLTVSDHDGGYYLFVESLRQKQEYSLKVAAANDAGISEFTEWMNLTTTSAGE